MSGASRSQAAELVDLLRRNDDYRRLFSATVVSFLGDWFSFVAVSALVTELTGRPGAPALVFAAEVLPVFLLSPLAGVVADRFDRRRVMIAADLVRVVPALALVAAAVWGQAWLAFVCVAALSAFSPFFQAVGSAVIPNLVPREDLSLAQAAVGSVWGTMLFVGAALGGVAAAVLGREASFVLNAVTFVVSALLVARIRRPLRTGPVAAPGTVLQHLGQVWAVARERKLIRALMTTKAGVGIGNGIVGLLPVYALSRFGSGDAGIGLLFAARGLGALVGPYLGRALARGRDGREDGRRHLAVIGWSIVSYALAYALLPSAGTLVVGALCVTAAHVGGGAQWVLSTHGLQLTTADTIRGRVMGIDYGLATLSMGVSSLAAGAAAELLGLEAASYLLVAAALVYGIAWLTWTRDLRSSAHDPFIVADPDRAEAPA